MTGFSTDRLEPTARGEPLSKQAEHDVMGKPARRPRAQPKKIVTPQPDALEPSEPLHQIDDLA
jgi:hypothetical protein